MQLGFGFFACQLAGLQCLATICSSGLSIAILIVDHFSAAMLDLRTRSKFGLVVAASFLLFSFPALHDQTLLLLSALNPALTPVPNNLQPCLACHAQMLCVAWTLFPSTAFHLATLSWAWLLHLNMRCSAWCSLCPDALTAFHVAPHLWVTDWSFLQTLPQCCSPVCMLQL